MNKLCTQCGSQIPFIASVCPNCTRDIVTSNDASAAITLIAILLLCCVVVGIGEVIKYIIHY